jgi:phosphatidylglycerol lysyltransferase
MLHRWSTWIAVVVFAVAVFAIDRVLGRYHWAEVAAHLYAIPSQTLLLAAGLTVGSYLVLSLYDLLGVRNAGGSLPWRTVATASFAAYAVAHNVGFAALSGGSIRYRIYSRAGLGGLQIAQVIAFCTLTFALGSALLCGISLALRAEQAGPLLHIGTGFARAAGWALIVAVTAYVATGTVRRKPVRFRGVQVQLPGPGMSLLQVIVACVDMGLAAGVLYVLMPPGSTDGYLTFLSIYLLATAAGLVSSVPGGLGVFEYVLVLLTPHGAADQKLAAILAYRIIYFLAPFLLAVAVMVGHEALANRHMFGRWVTWGRAWLRVITPHAIAAAVFLGGVVLLFSGATPIMDERLHLLRHIVPPPLLEASHLLGSAAGVALLFLAQSLQRRLDAAWHVTLWLLVVGAIASLAKGFDYEEALILLAMVVMLVLARDRYHRKASLLDQRFSPAWVAAAIVALAASVWLALFSHRHVDFSQELWWQFAMDADLPRTLRATLLSIVLAGAVGAWMLLRPAALEYVLPTATDLARAQQAIRAATDTNANLALLGDKNLLFSPDGAGFVMFRPVGRSWIAMGDPVGPPEVRASLVWAFREACDRYAARAVFYQVGVEDLPNYLDAGLTLAKIGEEAHVDLKEFNLQGPRAADLRQTHRRALRDGATCEVLPASAVPALLPELRRISDNWLAAKSVAEKGFSLGRFDDVYLSRFSCAVVRVGGRPVAFANIWTTGNKHELSIDLMRHDDTAPKSVMDFLMIELMLWGQAQGFQWFNLGMAPLSGLADRDFSPTWNRVGAFVYRHGEHFYNFEGLRAYKDKFHPVWRPRYIASPGRTAMPRIIMDVTSLIAGSPRRILMRSPWLIGALAIVLSHAAGAAEPLSESQRHVESAGNALRLAIPASALLATFLLDPVNDQVAGEADVQRSRFNLLHLGGSPRHDLALALGRTWVVTDALKYAVGETRPDGGPRSFPSGHASVAFAGAEFMRVQYGWKWAAPAYAAATFVAWSRVEARRHYTHDVIAGALIGVLANHDLHEWHTRAGQLSLVPASIMSAGDIAPGIQLALSIKNL